MSVHFWVLVAAVAVFLAGAGLIWWPLRTAWREARYARARRDFHWQRERLEAKFVQLGLIHTKGRAPRWTDCRFDDDVAYARNRATGELTAYVAAAIEMEAFRRGRLPGGCNTLEGVRAATAVFRFDGDHWETDGRAIFNLSPTETISFYQRDLEMVGQEVADRP